MAACKKKKPARKTARGTRPKKKMAPIPPPKRDPGQRLFWVMKSEPSVFSVEDLRMKPGSTSQWDGVRNYQARNSMMQMKVGDGVLFYHSSDEPVGVAGLAEVVRESYPDYTAWDPKSDYYDPKSTPEKPRWFMVDVKWVETFDEVLPLSELRGRKALAKMIMLRKGNRLSVTPVSAGEYESIIALVKRER